MEFQKLSKNGMEQRVGQLVNEAVDFQMVDVHAYYFDAVNGKTEFKVVKDQEELSLHERTTGDEDWSQYYGIDLN